jgi:hypothetical protein
MELTINQIVRYKSKRWKIVQILSEDLVKLKCMVCGSKYEIVHKDQL